MVTPSTLLDITPKGNQRSEKVDKWDEIQIFLLFLVYFRYLNLIMITETKTYLKWFFLLAHTIGMTGLSVLNFAAAGLHITHADSFDGAEHILSLEIQC